MQKVVDIKNILKVNYFSKIFETFEPILKNLALPREEYELQKKYLKRFNNYSEEELALNEINKFHNFFKNLIIISFIDDSLKVHDLIREAYLNRIAIESPNCLIECRDFHGCCHGNYSVELMDYKRIISENLFPPENFYYKYHKYRIKLKKIGNEPFCSAFDYKTKLCLIHKYKPPTCSKYPLTTNVFTWDKDQKLWIGSCAHGGTWTSYASSIILDGLCKLWIKTIMLWEKEQEFLSNFHHKLNTNQIILGKRLLSIKINRYNKRYSIINLLSNDFSMNNIDHMMKLLKI